MGKHSPKKDRKKDEKKEENDSSFKGFLKKRAPIYGLILTVFVIFLAAEFTGGSIEDHLGTLSGPEGRALEILKSYDGPNDLGLKLVDALSDQIKSEYSNEKIFDHSDTKSSLVVELREGEKSIYDISWSFETHRETIDYVWTIDVNSEEVIPENSAAKRIVNLVDYYD